MQIQIYKKDTNEMIAWLDTKENNMVLHKDYDAKTGNHLNVAPIDVQEEE